MTLLQELNSAMISVLLPPSVTNCSNWSFMHMKLSSVAQASNRSADFSPLQLSNAASACHVLEALKQQALKRNKFRAPQKSSQAATSRTRSAQSAFTLIELLLVLVILGILAAIVVPKFSGRTEQARQTAAQSQIATFGTALDAFEVDTGYYPKGKNGLAELVQQPRDVQTWKGPYLKGDLPNDPWGHPYIYECPGKHNPTSYDVMSMGPDGRVGGDDDITNWTQKR